MGRFFIQKFFSLLLALMIMFFESSLIASAENKNSLQYFANLEYNITSNFLLEDMSYVELEELKLDFKDCLRCLEIAPFFYDKELYSQFIGMRNEIQEMKESEDDSFQLELQDARWRLSSEDIYIQSKESFIEGQEKKGKNALLQRKALDLLKQTRFIKVDCIAECREKTPIYIADQKRKIKDVLDKIEEQISTWVVVDIKECFNKNVVVREKIKQSGLDGLDIKPARNDK